MKPQPAGNEFAAVIGIDWADVKHDICLQAANGARRESSVLPHRPIPPRRGRVRFDNASGGGP